jgi:hypothetical protein
LFARLFVAKIEDQVLVPSPAVSAHAQAPVGSAPAFHILSMMIYASISQKRIPDWGNRDNNPWTSINYLVIIINAPV